MKGNMGHRGFRFFLVLGARATATGVAGPILAPAGVRGDNLLFVAPTG